MHHPTFFSKMHGLGNDFVIINAMNQPLPLDKLPIKKLADRHLGIGFDQLLVIEPSTKADFFCRIFNSDGSEAKQCGNGLRCVARFLHEEDIHTTSSLTIETLAGIFPIFIQDYQHIRVTMGTPLVREKLISVTLPTNNSLPISIISMGNPHAIVKLESIENISINQLGGEIAALAHFPDGANVGFMRIITPDQINLRTYERGAGETLACGSNACAAAVAGIINDLLTHCVHIHFQHGELVVEWEGLNQPLHMSGPATRVFSGNLDNFI